MIQQKTAAAIYQAHREIEAGQQLLTDLAAEKERCKFSEMEPRIEDVFGRRRRFQLGIPTGNDSHRLLSVSAALAESVIRAHIAETEAELAKLNEIALIEASTQSRAGKE